MNSSKDTNDLFSIGTVISDDGTIIGYRQIGSGPGLILVHGGMMASQNFVKLATALSGSFTVYMPDRRGRGLSGPFGNDYSVIKDVQDIQAIVTKTGATNLFGLSSGAIISLNAALNIPSILKLALYEPPLLLPGISTIDWATRYEKELAQGKLAAAMITVIKGTDDDILFKIMPRLILEQLFKLAIAEDDKKAKGTDVPLRTLIGTMEYDVKLVRGSAGMLDQSKKISSDVLLLGGSRSQPFLKAALDALEKVLPKARRIALKGLGHVAADNNGKPEVVAKELIRFFC